jgi:hypothetical protein
MKSAGRGVSYAPLLLAAMLGACAGTPVETHYYLLRPEPPLQTRGLQPSTEYAMGEVSVAPYIDQPGLVLELGPGEVRPARHHQWAEPMAGALPNFLLLEVSRAVDADVFHEFDSAAPLVFAVRIDQLHGTADGHALLVAYWRLRNKGEEIASYQLVERQALTRDGYDALAEAETLLLKKLARRIAESLKSVRAGL